MVGDARTRVIDWQVYVVESYLGFRSGRRRFRGRDLSEDRLSDVKAATS